MEETKTAVLAIHKDKMKISYDRQPNSLVAKVLSIHYAGSQIRIQVQVDKILLLLSNISKVNASIKKKIRSIYPGIPGAVLLPLY